jgi:hypothetical protein
VVATVSGLTVAFDGCPAVFGAVPDEDPIVREALPTIARLQYDGGGDWYANPSSLTNLLAEITLRTGIRVDDRAVEVRLSDPDLGDYPYLG